MTASATSQTRVIVLGCWAHSYAGPTTSFFVETRTTRILLDVGCDPIRNLKAAEIDPTSIDAVYLSHLHSDHSSGIANFLFTRILLARKRALRTERLMVLAHEETLDGARRLVRIQYPDRDLPADWIPLQKREPVALSDDSTIEIFVNKHTIPCHGAIIRSGGKTIAFTSDTAPHEDHPSIMAGSNLIIGECFGLAVDAGPDIHQRGHSTAEDLAALASKCGPEILVPFHFGERYFEQSSRRLLLTTCAKGHSARVVDPISEPVVTI